MNELLDGQTAKGVNWWVNEQMPSNPFHVPLPSSTATFSRLRLMFIGATIVHVFVLGSYLSTELSELCAAPGK